ncbi:hypothetical protein [Anaerotignum sp. MB30-C6]|uniref:hypothetical protein n=1 Tax=Anaerotignum sp. MB30-C6 TaxID=3070814 RepID=UPI0027DB9A0B|nr:hypothetical protein [Anaerotignum sp. MB30-C6]WMI80593.1 hypothetical protein RBQ60_12260 [Anaerotignum sp. MB30-C6]
MKTQLMKLAGASILAFSISFLSFMSLTVAIQKVHEKQDATRIQAEQTMVEDTTLAAVLH